MLFRSGLAPSRQAPVRPASEAPEPAWGIDDLGRATGTTLEVQLGGAGGEDRGGDDDAGYADEFVHGVCSEVAELLEVEAGLDEDLDIRYGFFGTVRVTGEGEEDRPCCSCGGSLKLRKGMRGGVEIDRSSKRTDGRISPGFSWMTCASSSLYKPTWRRSTSI